MEAVRIWLGEVAIVDLALHEIVNVTAADRATRIGAVPNDVVDEHVEAVSAVLLRQLKIRRVNDRIRDLKHTHGFGAIGAVPIVWIRAVGPLPERSPENEVDRRL